jgi:aspartyl/asparaginyl beta-hydroxylase (cupin superfamily)
VAAQDPRPLATNDRVTFTIDGTGYHFREGEAVELNNMAAHSVANGGDTDRVHLIFEYYDLDQPPPEWAPQTAVGRHPQAMRRRGD